MSLGRLKRRGRGERRQVEKRSGQLSCNQPRLQVFPGLHRRTGAYLRDQSTEPLRCVFLPQVWSSYLRPQGSKGRFCCSGAADLLLCLSARGGSLQYDRAAEGHQGSHADFLNCFSVPCDDRGAFFDTRVNTGKEAVFLFNFKLQGETIDELRAYSAATGVPMGEYLRRLIRDDSAARSAVLSGGAVTGRTVHTTSGELHSFTRY